MCTISEDLPAVVTRLQALLGPNQPTNSPLGPNSSLNYEPPKPLVSAQTARKIVPASVLETAGLPAVQSRTLPPSTSKSAPKLLPVNEGTPVSSDELCEVCFTELTKKTLQIWILQRKIILTDIQLITTPCAISIDRVSNKSHLAAF